MAAPPPRQPSSHHWPRLLEGPRPMVPPEEEEEEARDWAGLPCDALLAVIHKLGHVDVLMGAGQVCRPWRRAARDEPELWRRVDMRFLHAGLSSRVDLHRMARAAVRRSAGQCEAFWAEGAVDDSVLSLLAGSPSLSLKSLRLISCRSIHDRRPASAITKFPLLEELEISNCGGDVDFPETCAAAGKACPLLKRLQLRSSRFIKRDLTDADGEARAIAATMRRLRSLQLFARRLSGGGLAAILDGCASLESLDIRHCFNVKMDDNEMRARCSGIGTLRLPRDSTDDYDLEFSSLGWLGPRGREPTERLLRMGVQFKVVQLNTYSHYSVSSTKSGVSTRCCQMLVGLIRFNL